MAQHDYIIDNQTSAALRADLNNALAAIVSQNSGATAPTTTYANQFWYDTANDQLKQRNETNSAWIVLGTVDQTTSKFEPNQTFASQAQAETGTNNTLPMTPLRVAQAIDTQAVNVGVGASQTWSRVNRTAGTAYQNTTGKAIMYTQSAYSPSSASTIEITAAPTNTGYATIAFSKAGTAEVAFVSVIIPSSWYYKTSNTTSTADNDSARELK